MELTAPLVAGRRRRRPWLVGGLVLIGLALAALLLQPWWLGPLVAHRLSAASGRTVHFESLWFGLGAGLRPVLHGRGIRIDNAAWAATTRPFAELEEMVAAISWRSFGERRPVIERLVLRGGRVELERLADGLRNWRLNQPEDRGPGKIKILSLQADRATIRLLHHALALDLEAAATPNPAAPSTEAGAAALSTRIALKGSWRQLGFEGQVETAEALTFAETGRTFPLRGHVVTGGVRIDAEGLAADILREPTFDARVVVAGSSLAAFKAFIGGVPVTPKNFRIEGRLKASDRAYALSEAQARFGATLLTGDAAFVQAEPRPRLRARLRSESVDVGDLMWLAGHPAAPATAAPSAHAERAAPGRGAGPGAFSAARAFDADLVFNARRLHDARVPLLQSAALEASLADGLLRVVSMDVGVARGHVVGHAAIDLREAAGPAEADLTAQGIRLDELWRQPDAAKRITGVLQGRAELKAKGASWAAWLASASGQVSAKLTGGTMPGLLDAELGLQGGRILRSLLGGSQPVAVQCAGAVLDVRDGRAVVRSLAIDTERTRTVGSGAIDLKAETMDLVLTPTAKQGGLFDIDRSIRLQGPILKPGRGLVARAAPGAAQGRACPG